MIFVLHYLLFNAGLPAVIILITLFLQTYSNASMSEIGALLMALPFVSIVIKPLFCALADRQQAHKLYLMSALALMGLGYGSLTIAPFFPDFIAEHGRTVWYFDIVGIIIGFSAFGVIWSLGDALAVNHAQMKGITWGSYRVWGVVSWGGFGIIIGQINEVPFLPKYVPAFFVLIATLLVEIILLAFWPNKHFVMGGTLDEASLKQTAGSGENGSIRYVNQDATTGADGQQQQMHDMEDNWSSANRSLSGTLRGTARANPRMIGAVANIFMEDLGGTLRSSLKFGSKSKRMGLDEILAQHQIVARPANGSLRHKAAESALAAALTSTTSCPMGQHQILPAQSAAGGGGGGSPTSHNTSAGAMAQSKTNNSSSTANAGPTFGRATLRRAQMALARMNSLSAASGHVIVDELTTNTSSSNNNNNVNMNSCQNDSMVSSATSTPTMPAGHNQHKRQQVMYMSSLASDTSVGKAAAARMFTLKESPLSLVSTTQANGNANGNNNNNNLINNISSNNNFSSLNNNNLPVTPVVGSIDSKDKQLVAIDLDDPQQLGLDGVGKTKQLRSPEDLQLVLLKLIVRRDTTIWKLLVMFTIFGALLTVHLSYFYLHMETLCRQSGDNFSSVTGGMLLSHSISEVLSFTFVVPYLVPKLGRCGSLLTCALIYAARFAYYGTFLTQASPYTAIPFELAHGIVYGIVYSLITDIACETVNQVDLYLPELIERGVVDESIDPNRLKLQLRATMQGLFSGAFDGLGNGLGALFGGVFLDAYPFPSGKLWQFCTYVCLVTIVVYPLTEWDTFFGKKQQQQKQGDKSKQAKC